MEELVDRMIAFIRTHADWAGPIVFVLCFAESLAIISLFAPATVILIGAGALAATGILDPWVLIIWAIPGAALGDAVSYWVGKYLRHWIPNVWPFSRHPRLLERGEVFFRKWGTLSVFIGRFMGPLRAIVPLVAGMMRMKQWTFQIANVTSAIIWAPLVFFEGAVLGIFIRWISAKIGFDGVIAVLLVGTLVLYAAWMAWREWRNARRQS